MAWLPFKAFNPQRHADGRRFLIAGVHPNNVRWVDCCGWDPRGWFRGHRMEEPMWWQYLPDPPTAAEEEMMSMLDQMLG